MVDRDSYWGTDAQGRSPWLQVDLGEAQGLRGVELFTYWSGRRYYHYTIEVFPGRTELDPGSRCQ